jgi:hypothetical protein
MKILKDKKGMLIKSWDIVKGSGIDGKIRQWIMPHQTKKYEHFWEETKWIINKYKDLEIVGSVVDNPEQAIICYNYKEQIVYAQITLNKLQSGVIIDQSTLNN